MDSDRPRHIQIQSPSSDWQKAWRPDWQDSVVPFSFTRFQNFQLKPQELVGACPQDAYILNIHMGRVQGSAYINGKITSDGPTRPGAIHIAHPGDNLRGITFGKVDVSLMTLPVSLLSDMLLEAEVSSGHKTAEILRRANFVQDPRLLVLFQALSDVRSSPSGLERLRTDALGMAIVSKLLGSYSAHAKDMARMRRHGLSEFQLRRVHDFVNAHIGYPISLPSLARAAGLSRMHFAAQFRRSTGLSPHDYVLRERVRKAQQILSETRISVLQTALSVGFHTQSHFSTVFKRIVGDTPARWRVDSNVQSAKRFVGMSAKPSVSDENDERQ
jgi:AraC family transcriptional regulator